MGFSRDSVDIPSLFGYNKTISRIRDAFPLGRQPFLNRMASKEHKKGYL
jgi:hypothetical protein